MKNAKRILSLAIVLCMLLSLFSCNWFKKDDKNGNDNDGNNETIAPKEEITEAKSIVTIDINPSVELTLDADGTVVSIYGANEDGRILLWGESGKIIGVNYEAAIEYITELAVNLKYLNDKTGTVVTSVVSDSEAMASSIQEKISAKIKSVAGSGGFAVKIDTSDAFSLLCELNELKEKHPKNSRIASLTPTEYKLALILSERESITIEAAVNYNRQEIITRISSAHKTLESYATDAYLAAKREATRIFNASMGVIIDGVYNEIYMANPLAHLDTYYYGAIYQAYKSTARTYSSIYEIKRFADSMASFEVSPDTVESIKTELGIKDSSVLENENGRITVESLIEFCDGFIRENKVSEDVKAKIETIISEARLARELANKATTTLYKADIESLIGRINQVISAVRLQYNTVAVLMSNAAKADMEAAISDLENVVGNLEKIREGGITESEVYDLALAADAKATDMLEKIRADLSATEWSTSNARISALQATAGQLTADFEARLSAAGAEAKTYIENARKEREK